MKMRLIILVALALLLLSSVLYGDDKGMKLELNNEVVLKSGDVLNVGGTTYVDAQKLSRLMGFDFFSFSGGTSIVLRTIREEREYFLYFNPEGSGNKEEAALINRGGGRNLDLDQKSVDYMTTEMYDKIEEEARRAKQKGARLDLLKKDYEKVVEEASYISREERTFIPIKAVAKAMELSLKWDPRSNSVLLYTEPEDGLPKRKAHRIKFTEEDVNLLAKIATVEAGGGSEYKQLAVCNVVLNRLESERFPNTVRGVIYQSGQFPPVHYDDFETMKPYKSAIRAAYRALYGENNVPRVLFFNLAPFEGKDESDFYGIIEGDYFYY